MYHIANRTRKRHISAITVTGVYARHKVLEPGAIRRGDPGSTATPYGTKHWIQDALNKDRITLSVHTYSTHIPHTVLYNLNSVTLKYKLWVTIQTHDSVL